jgi:hypothetical protein
MKQVDELMARIQEKWGYQAVQTARHLSLAENRSYPSGFQALDALIGGIPRSHLTEITGRPSSGMTTLVYHSLALAQQQGANIVVIDNISNLDIQAATEFGLNLEKLVLVEVEELNLLLNLLPELLNSGVVHYLLVNLMSLRQNLLSLRALSPFLQKSDCAVTLLIPRSTKSDIAALRLHIQRRKWLKQGKDIIGCLSSVQVEKQRFGKAGRECLLLLPFEDRIIV